MASSVRIQEPYPLTAHPFSVSLTRRIALLPPPAHASSSLVVAPHHFLTAAVPERAYGHGGDDHNNNSEDGAAAAAAAAAAAVDHVAQVVTVQGSAVYLYDLQRQQCLHSWSVPPGTLFSSPARYLPERPAHDDLSSAASATAAIADDVTNDDDVQASSFSNNNLAGNVYAIIHTGTDIPAKEEQKSVWMWQVDASVAGKAVGEDSKPTPPPRAGKPDTAAIFDSPIQHLATFVPCKTAAAAYVVLLHAGGNVTVASRALKTVATWSSSPSSSTDDAAAAPQVIWTTTFTERENENDKHDSDDDAAWKVLRIVSVLRRRVGGQDIYSLRVLVVSAKETSGRDGSAATVDLLSETAIPMPVASASAATSVPVSFTVVAQQLVVAFSDSQVRIFEISSGGGASNESLCFSLAECKYALPTNPATLGGPTMLSMHPIANNYIAVVGSTAASRKAAGDELLTIWDIKYGAMHLQKLLNASEKSSSAAVGSANAVGENGLAHGGNRRGGRAFHTTMTVSPLTGPVITIATSRLHSLTPVTFSSTVDFVPFHCPPLTLAAVLGKLRKPLFPASSSSSSLPLGSVIDHNAIKPIGMGMATTAPVPPAFDNDTLAAWNSQLHDLDAVDVDYVQRLLTQIDSATFSKLFCEWMQKKLRSLHAINVQASEAARRRLQRSVEQKVGKKEKKRLDNKAAETVDAMDVDGSDETADVKTEAAVKDEADETAMDVDVDDADTKLEAEDAVTAPPPPPPQQQQQQQQPPLATYLTTKPSPKLLNRLPKVLISPTALNPLLAFCLRHPTKGQTFWPRHAIQYMLRSGTASTKCIPNGILAAALEKGDMATMETALRWCADLGEEEVVRAVQWVCVSSVDDDDDKAGDVAEKRTRVLDRWADATRRVRETKKAGMNIERSRQANLPEEGVELEVDLAEVAEEIDGEVKTEKDVKMEPSSTSSSLSTTTTTTTTTATTTKTTTAIADPAARVLPGRGRAQFLRAIFARPRTDTFFVRALKKLSVEEVTVLLDWLHGILVVSKAEEDSSGDDDVKAEESEIQHRAPLWWFWEQPKFDAASVCQERGLEEWDMALDVLPIILTAHLTTILHTPHLVAQLTAIQESISLQTRLFTTLQTRLRAPLLLVHAEMAKKVEEENELANQQQQKQQQHAGKADLARFDADGNDKTKGRRYKRMVEDVAGAKYEVEIYKI
ncbi:hypothetical protein BDZ88DRAFT_432872 [Geranomyces variabilis]|nr:hypothetical protein BDZ88DRAFT_432872 [Geranomyces variabilis]KAJ3134084.1 hypothetical protein HDU90_005432 [Geranomyces variabilis]